MAIGFFEGMVNGEILTERTGSVGLVTTPVFRPDGYTTSFAQMSMEDKNIISHRGIAVMKLAEFLNHLYFCAAHNSMGLVYCLNEELENEFLRY